MAFFPNGALEIHSICCSIILLAYHTVKILVWKKSAEERLIFWEPNANRDQGRYRDALQWCWWQGLRILIWKKEEDGPKKIRISSVSTHSTTNLYNSAAMSNVYTNVESRRIKLFSRLIFRQYSATFCCSAIHCGGMQCFRAPFGKKCILLDSFFYSVC